MKIYFFNYEYYLSKNNLENRYTYITCDCLFMLKWKVLYLAKNKTTIEIEGNLEGNDFPPMTTVCLHFKRSADIQFTGSKKIP